MAETQETLRQLRGLRFSPPAYAASGGRASTFRAALEQCEQFLMAAREAGYATRPLHLFYALSQASRAVVAASPRVNQSWRVRGHGLSSTASATTVDPAAGKTTVSAAASGLFISLAEAIGREPLPVGHATALEELWPLLPETVDIPITLEAEHPALLFMPTNWPSDFPFALAGVHWIPRHVRQRCGDDKAMVAAYFQRFPSLRAARVPAHPIGGLLWEEAGPGFGINIEWPDDSGMRPTQHRTVDDLKISSYRSAEDLFVTPAIGSMSEGLHPLLALWAVLHGLSSLARYEPSTWAHICNIDHSREANAVEHFLDEALISVPAAVLHQLTTFN